MERSEHIDLERCLTYSRYEVAARTLINTRQGSRA
jgi:hypothetical protein